MTNLLECVVKSIDLRKSHYYDGQGVSYNDAIDNSRKFIEEYFYKGGKFSFLLNTITDNNDYDEGRCNHVVNTYYTGLYLLGKIDYLQIKTPLFNNDKDYLWAWFLCALYHDAFAAEETDHSINCTFGYARYSERLLYDAKTLQKYYWKNINRGTSFDGKTHYNHGIVGADALYQKFIKVLEESIKNNICSISDFFNSGALLGCGDMDRLVSYKSFVSMCKIAKVIASHAIFIADKTEEDKFRKAGLDNLIPTNNIFCKMPNKKSRLNAYEKLYFLLSLVDNIEPTKSGCSMEDIIIDIYRINLKQYLIHIETDKNLSAYNNYFNNLAKLPNWLSFVFCANLKDNSIDLKLVF